MDLAPHFQSYLQYLDKNPNATFKHQFKCGAVRGQRPKLHNMVPTGDCFVYENFVIFLTEARSSTGMQSLFSNAIDFVGTDIALLRWGHNPASILVDVVKSVHAFLTPEQVEKRLVNPNSIFVPCQTITRVDQGHDLTQGNYITLRSHDGDVVLAEHLCEWPNPLKDLMNGRRPTFVSPQFVFGKIKGEITGQWHPEVVSTIRTTIG